MTTCLFLKQACDVDKGENFSLGDNYVIFSCFRKDEYDIVQVGL